MVKCSEFSLLRAFTRKLNYGLTVLSIAVKLCAYAFDVTSFVPFCVLYKIQIMQKVPYFTLIQNTQTFTPIYAYNECRLTRH